MSDRRLRGHRLNEPVPGIGVLRLCSAISYGMFFAENIGFGCSSHGIGRNRYSIRLLAFASRFCIIALLEIFLVTGFWGFSFTFRRLKTRKISSFPFLRQKITLA